MDYQMKVICKGCGKSLKIDSHGYDETLNIFVMPCESCMEKKYGEGWSDMEKNAIDIFRAGN